MFETPEQHSSISVSFLDSAAAHIQTDCDKNTHYLQALCLTVTSRSPSRTNSRITGLIGSWVFHCRGGVRKADTRTGNFQRFLYLWVFFPFLFVPPFLSLAVTKVSSGCNTSRASPLMNRSAFVLFSRVLTVTAS